MDDDSFDDSRPGTRNKCCLGPFPRASPERVITSSNSVFSYDSKVFGNRQVVVDMPWEPGLPEAMDRGMERKVKIEVEEEGEGLKAMHCCHGREWESLKCWKSSASSCSFCGVICSPLLTSRLALTGLLAVLLIVMTVLTWVFTSTNVQHSVRSVAADFRHELLLRVEDTVVATLQSSNTSSASLAKYLSSLSQVTLTSFASLEDQLRPALFLVFSILGRKAQVSFFGKSGFVLSYAADSSGTFLMYANTSYLVPASLNASTSHVLEIPWKEGEELISSRPWYKWYRQNVDENTGFPNGEPMPITPFAFWDNDPMKTALLSEYGGTYLAPSVAESREPLFSFLSSVGQSGSAESSGAISVGMPFASIGNLFDQFDLQGGAIYLTMADGRLIGQTEVTAQAYDSINNSTKGLSSAAQSNNPIVASAAEYLTPHLPAILASTYDSFTASVDLKGTRYLIDSASIHPSKEALVCVVVIPHESIWRITERRSRLTLAVLIALATCMGLVGCFFVVLLTKGVSNEMRLRAALIQQLEETKTAETKSSHKSLVFANMSHDLRTPLAAILGLIDLCLSDASECSELETNLLQMKSCASNLLGILNTILDMSKIEAGKLSLQESEFDLVTALEEVVDTFSVMGFKKGVEVALDLSDGSVEKASCVIGDVGRVKQIMANLLSNGVKFTSEGHVILRAWVKPLGISTITPPFSYKGRFSSWPWNQLLRSPSRHKEIYKLIHRLSEQAHEQSSYIQVEFEVDDTGRGIPKERWKSVFENFVQIESSGPRNYDGTGLGLGIVRSMVRLMGGDISIIDKDEPGEPGTRFRFNLIFKCCKQKSASGGEKGLRQDILLHDRGSLQATFGVNSTSAASGWRINPAATPGYFEDLADSGFMSPSAMEGVHVLLAMKGQGGKKIVKKWMERRGLQVWTVGDWEELGPMVERIKGEMLLESFHNSGRYEPISPESQFYDSWVDDLDNEKSGRVRSSMDTSLHQRPLCGAGSPVNSVLEQRFDGYQTRAHLLIIVDITMVTQRLKTSCSDLEDMLPEASRLLSYKIVWLVNSNTPSIDIQFLKSHTRACSLILHKPLYASRLQCIWQLLEELTGNEMQEKDEGEGEAPIFSPESCGERVLDETKNSLYTSLSCMNTFRETKSWSSNHLTQGKLKQESSLPSSTRRLVPMKLETNKEGEELCSSAVQSSDMPVTEVEKPLPLTPPSQSKPQNSPENKSSKVKRLSKEIPRDSQLLSAMHILVAEDNLILQRLTKTQLVRLGASVECVDNGAEAVRLVLENLYKSKVSPAERDEPHEGEPQGANKPKGNQPFDLVVMDCEMPELNGYEATQRIRSEESRYGIRTPVIALTAHAMAQDERKCIEAGMDFYLTKPLAMDALLDVVNKILERKKS